MTEKEFRALLIQNSKYMQMFFLFFVRVHPVNAITYFSFHLDFSTVYEDQLQKHLKKCNSREKPKPVSAV